MKKLLVGLGNPGDKYQNTRHNAGFIVLEHLAKELGAEYVNEKKFQSEVAVEKQDTSELHLLKPQTFMNNSGKAVKVYLEYFKIAPENLLVIHDEIDLSFGETRLSESSGSAGHKGVESVIHELGHKNFSRLRIGINNRESRDLVPTESYVLQKFDETEIETFLNQIVPDTLNLINQWLKK